VTRLDGDLVDRWFGPLLRPDAGFAPVVRPIDATPQERAVLADGAALLGQAIAQRPPTGGLDGSDLTEAPARMLNIYLRALASGLRDALGRVGGDPDSAGSIALAAGLNAAAAAVHGEHIASSPTRPGGVGRSERTAAEAARLAGIAAAEVAVDGAALAAVAAAAARSVMEDWRPGTPRDPGERIEHRTRGLLGLLLVGLQRATADPVPPPEPASCGALPGENPGRRFPAEVTFQLGAAGDVNGIIAALRALPGEMTTWRDGGFVWCHVHTDSPGSVVEHAYARGSVFDLRITHAR
jgi:hypothetical protein